MLHNGSHTRFMQLKRSRLLLASFCLSVSLCFFGSLAAAQTLVVKVSDNQGAALPFSHITNQQKTKGTVTNEYGYARIDKALEDIIVSHMGYQEKTVSLLSANDTLIVKLGEQSISITDLKKDVDIDSLLDLVIESTSRYKLPRRINGFYREMNWQEEKVTLVQNVKYKIWTESLRSLEVDRETIDFPENKGVVWRNVTAESSIDSILVRFTPRRHFLEDRQAFSYEISGMIGDELLIQFVSSEFEGILSVDRQNRLVSVQAKSLEPLNRAQAKMLKKAVKLKVKTQVGNHYEKYTYENDQRIPTLYFSEGFFTGERYGMKGSSHFFRLFLLTDYSDKLEFDGQFAELPIPESIDEVQFSMFDLLK